jgi:hypothetical protein
MEAFGVVGSRGKPIRTFEHRRSVGASNRAVMNDAPERKRM